MQISIQSQYRIRQIIMESAYWSFSLTIFAIIKFSGDGHPFPEVDYKLFHPSFGRVLATSIVGGALLGVVLSTLRLRVLAKPCRKLSFGKTILAETIVYLIVFVILLIINMLLVYVTMVEAKNGFFDYLGQFLNTNTLYIASGFFFYASIQYTLFLQADKKLGIGVLKNLLLGKYYNPLQEYRIFMFLDMKNSTRVAEQLGHIQYSVLLQDSFKLLTDLLIEYKAEIYQFVGDEVVVTWDQRKGFKDDNSLMFYFAYRNLLKTNRLYFENKFGLFPEFKAAIHSGEVSVAEVGEIKTQIAYHGDVVNTTSRIQELCNKYNSQLLASEDYVKRLESQNSIDSKEVIEITLRGKETPIRIFDLSEN